MYKSTISSLNLLGIHCISERMLGVEEAFNRRPPLTHSGFEHDLFSGSHLGIPTNFLPIHLLTLVFYDCQFAQSCSCLFDAAHLLFFRCWNALLPPPRFELVFILWLTNWFVSNDWDSLCVVGDLLRVKPVMLLHGGNNFGQFELLIE